MVTALSQKAKGEIKEDVSVVDRILKYHLFYAQDPNQWSLFADMMIHLRDLVRKAEIYGGQRINFTDDVIQTPKVGQIGAVNDVSDLINFIRNSCAHPSANNKVIPGTNCVLSGNIIVGKGSLIGGQSVMQKATTCDYEDDIAINYGPQRIYMKRHITRAFEEAKQVLEPLL